jgi:hypothetical protein
MKANARSSVEVVTFFPDRNRLTSLPSFTESNPNVDGAIKLAERNSSTTATICACEVGRCTVENGITFDGVLFAVKVFSTNPTSPSIAREK